MTVTWVPVPDASRLQITPVGLRLVDDFTGRSPSSSISVTLEAAAGAGWRRVDHPATLTPSGWVAFLGLGRTTDPVGKPVVRHRASVQASGMVPLYGPSPDVERVEFDVHPFDDRNPPAISAVALDVFLLPATDYAFPAEVLIARGRVVDAASVPVARALVTHVNLERVLTDDRGEFALPLRWAAKGTTVQIDAADGAGHVGSASAAIPGGLRHALQIQIA
jgi:hypothetical protein